MTTKITPRASFTILNKRMAPINTAERLAAKAFFGLFCDVTKNCNPHIINPLLTSFAWSVRESIASGFYYTDRATDQYFSVQTSHSVNIKSLLQNES